MKLKNLIITLFLLASTALFTIAANTSFVTENLFFSKSAAGLTFAAPQPAPTLKPNRKQTGDEQLLEARDYNQNGIKVELPEVYDDSILQQMLRDAELKLASMQLFDQTSILQKLGAVSGASQQISSFGLNVQGPSLPGVVTTDKGGTNTTTEINKTSTNAAGQTTTESSLQTVGGIPTLDVQTTRPATNAPPVTAPAPTTSLPTGFSVASSRILNEQMQLTAEVQMLRLLLRGSLSSHFIKPDANGNANEMVKLKTTLGFPISIMPGDRFKDAVAIVEVEVEKQADLQGTEKPMITTLLPQEKTYNVAAITDKSVSIGGGVVTQIVGVSGSWLTGRKTYYLTQDQDTVALSFQPRETNRAGFRWQFRPVLGRRYVQEGLKRNFVQIAFPAPLDAAEGEIGKIYIRTYWRKYDYKKGVVGEIIPNSLVNNVVNYDIPRYRLNVSPMDFSHKNLENLGGGQMMVNLFGRFLPGTYIRIGNSILPSTTDYYFLRFTAPVNDLATKPVTLVAPDGTETVLEIKHMKDAATELAKPPIEEEASVETIDETNSRVTVTLQEPKYLDDKPGLSLIVGGRVFGYSTKLEGGKALLSAIVPTALLIDNPRVTVSSLFAPAGWRSDAKIKKYDAFSRTEKLVVLEQFKDDKGASHVRFLLYGNRLKNIAVVNPENLSFKQLPGGAQEDTLQMLELTAAQIQNNKYLVVQRPSERPFLLAVPAVEIKEKAVEPKPQERVTINSDDAVIEGIDINDIEKVIYKGREIKFEATDDRKLRLTGLVESGVTTNATTKTLVFVLKSGAKPTMRLEVINSRLETVSK
jgi:hypothetical protein